jgi:predicted flap endonuclease-1-like 5' DNA nuclease
MFGFVFAAGDWLSALVPIVIAVILLIGRLISSMKSTTPPPRNKQPRRPPETAERSLRPPQKQPAPQAPGQSQLNAEIEQFLKRAGDRPSREPALTPQPKTTQPKTPKRTSPKSLTREQPLDAEPVERRDFTSVGASVEKHLANRGFTQRAEHLADDIVRADQEMEQHMQKAFGRRVGTLGDETAKTSSTPVTDVEPVSAAPRSPAADTLGNLLSNPQNVKQAVILNEILQRPEHRW